MRVVLGGALFLALFCSAELLALRTVLTAELSRKMVHVAAGILAAALPIAMPFPEIALLAALFVPFMVVSRRLGLFPAIHGVERSTLGEAYFPAGIAAAALLFPDPLHYVYGVLVMAVSDALAGLVGARYGKRGYRLLMAPKTYLGSAVFCLASAALASVALALTGFGLVPAIVLAFAVAGVVTVVEAILGGGLDNVALPALGAAALSAATAIG